ncbi:MAG: hypothetical protein FWE61_10070 [Micrococcales bacterium]|nr:hypothetical protein [Micrococcales bacterium]
MNTTRAALTLGALAVAAIGLSACAGKNTPSPSADIAIHSTIPSTNPPSDHIQTSSAEVQNAYLHYSDTLNAVFQDGFRDWDTRLVPLTTGDASGAVTDDALLFSGLGYRAVGQLVVTSTWVDEYSDTDPEGNYTAKLTACVDSTGVELVAAGRDTVLPDPRGRFYATVVMQRWLPVRDDEGNIPPDPQGQGWWRVASENIDPGRPC